MPTLDEVAKKYSATIVRKRGLDIISVPVKCDGQIDIGFFRTERKYLGKVLPFLAREEFSPGLYTYGGQTESWLSLFGADEELCRALRTLLDGCATSIEWSASRATARVSILRGSPDGDSTGGERFFANLAMIANRLETIYVIGRSNDMPQNAGSLGPAKVRKIMLTSIFIGTFSFLMAVHYAFRR